MTLKLKLLLFLGVVVTGIYATTPGWLPVVLAAQMPAGWQLQKLDAAYPGLAGIKVNFLRVKGDLLNAGMMLSASDIHLRYRGLATDIGSLSLEVRPVANGARPAAAPTLDGLSLPVIPIAGDWPDISVAELQVTIYQPAAIETGAGTPVPLLALKFNDFSLLSRPGNGFTLAAQVDAGELPVAGGRLGVDAGADALRADLRFPADPDTPPWLAMAFEQLGQGDTTSARLGATFDAGPTGRTWLDPILARSTGGALLHAAGKLEIQAGFAGRQQQGIETASLAASGLQVVSNRGTLNIEARLQAEREGESITVNLPATARIEYRDSTAWIDGLVRGAVPGLELVPGTGATGRVTLASGSSLAFKHGARPSARFNGAAGLGFVSGGVDLHLQFDDLQAEMADLHKPQALTANGLARLRWEQQTPVAYASAELEASADQASLTIAGRLNISPEVVSFAQSDDFTAEFANLETRLQTGQALHSDQLKMQGQIDFTQAVTPPGAPLELHFNGPVSAHNMRVELPGDAHSPPLAAAAGELSGVLEVIADDGTLISTGSATLLAGSIEPPATSAERIDLAWQAFDLVELAGNLTTRTRGFTTELDGETWTGFDLDLDYDLVSNADARGSGTLVFDGGPQWPFAFSGNTRSDSWDITLPAVTVKLAQVCQLLRVAHFNLPAAIKLTDGYLELQGTLAAGDSLAANMLVAGHAMSASVQESRARNASFRLRTTYGASITASGPVAVEAIALAGGVDMSNIRAELTVEDAETFGLQDLSADLFDGQLVLRKLRYSNGGLEDSTIELRRIGLGRLLAFADIDGLEGTGTLEISLPLSSDSNGIMVKDGTFASTGPGRLAYKKEGVAGSNIGLQALQNFHYQVLSGTLDYQPSGAYRMAIHLEGKNPDLYGGHPVVFNLNINGSLPALFEALFMTGDFEESILKQLRIKQPE